MRIILRVLSICWTAFGVLGFIVYLSDGAFDTFTLIWTLIGFGFIYLTRNKNKKVKPEIPEKSDNKKPVPEKKFFEVFKVAGVSYRQKEISEIADTYLPENYFYTAPKKELIEDYMVDEKIYQYDFDFLDVELIEEPDNKYDKNAIRVVVEGIDVGYIKRSDCKHVKELIQNDKILNATAFIFGGKYRILFDEDYDGNYVLKRGKHNYYIRIKLDIKN